MSLVAAVLTLISVLSYKSHAVCPCAQRAAALQDLYDATGGPAWSTPWNFSDVDAPCTFMGVACSSGDVTALELPFRGLRGTLPASLSTLTNLTRLDMPNNTLSGTIPHEISALTMMAMFTVASNLLSGSMPAALASWTSLKMFTASNNRLSGTLPAEYSAWASLQQFDISNNNISGTLPAAYAGWALLTVFAVQLNRLTGTLPAAFRAWSVLDEFDVRYNSISGSLPPELAAWVRIRDFKVSSNPIASTLPPEYSAWTMVQNFWADNSQVTGTLPAAYSQWGESMIWLSMFNAQLSGTLPSEYSTLTSLQQFRFNNNSLTGTLPAAYSAWQSVLYIDLRYNQLTGSVPDTWGGMTWIGFLFLSENSLSGTLPPSIVQLPALKSISVCYNNLSGTIPSDLSGSVNSIDIQNNPHVVGTVPTSITRPRVFTTCNTGISCLGPPSFVDPRYCFPKGFDLLSISFDNVIHNSAALMVMLQPYWFDCTSTRAPTPQPLPHRPTTYSLSTRPTKTSIVLLAQLRASFHDTTVTRIVTAAAMYGSLAAGGAVIARGAVPALQRAGGALRLASRCSNTADSSDDIMFSGLADNPLGLSVPVGTTPPDLLTYAAGAALGNAVLTVGVGVCFHAAALLRQKAQMRWFARSSLPVALAIGLLPSSQLPGALSVGLGPLLQPAVAASVALVVSEQRTPRSVVCGVAMLLVWAAFPAYSAWRVLSSSLGGKNAGFALDNKPVTRSGNASRLGSKKGTQWNCDKSSDQPASALITIAKLRAFVCAPRTQWSLPVSGNDAAVFLLEHMEAVFGGYTGRREWFFTIEWGTAAAGGLVLGAAEAWERGRPCGELCGGDVGDLVPHRDGRSARWIVRVAAAAFRTARDVVGARGGHDDRCGRSPFVSRAIRRS